MSKEFGCIPQLIHFQSMDLDILLHEHFMELDTVNVSIYETKPLSKESVESEVGSLLHVTLQDHITELKLLAFSNV